MWANVPSRLRAVFGRVRAEDGSGLTEFAFVFGIYVLVTLGTIQIAMWAFTTAAAQFAVWEGCRAGAATYQPPPPDARDADSLGPGNDWTSTEYAAEAEFAAVERTHRVLNWLPITAEYRDLQATVVEEDVLPGEEGQREIVTSVSVRPFIFVPGLGPMLDATNPKEFAFERTCRLRLGRFYSF
jgi:hypothetical protein